VNEHLREIVRLAITSYLGRDDGDYDCRSDLIMILEMTNRYDGSTDFLHLLDTCLKIGAMYELDPPWENANVYGFVDIDETEETRPQMPAYLVQKAFSTLDLDDDVITIIRQLPSNRLSDYRGVPEEYSGYSGLFFDGQSCWLSNGTEQAVV